MIEIEYRWLGLTVLAVMLASVHLWFPRFDTQYAAQSDRWMGLIGGVANCYVVLYLLPKIARTTAGIVGLDETAEIEFMHLQLYYLLLSGILVYLVMVHLDSSGPRWQALATQFDYTVHGAYSFLLGYVFVEVSSDMIGTMMIFAVIFGLHLLGMNHILRSKRPQGYDRSARWIFTLLLLIGATLGLITELPKMFVSALSAFLAGIILVNVISEELPVAHRSRVPWFMGGIGLYLLASYLVLITDPQNAY